MNQRPAEMAAPIDAHEESGGIAKNETAPDWMKRFIEERIDIAWRLNDTSKEENVKKKEEPKYNEKWYDNHGSDRPQ